MNLKSTRQVLSVLMAFVIALSLVLIAICSITGQTVCSKEFYIKNMTSEQLVNDCNAQLEMKYTVLSKKSNIPSDVFESVMNAYDTNENLKNAISYLFDENDATLNNQNMVKFFYDSCTEYLDANEIEYSESAITNVAVEAAQIYSDTVGIHNIEGVSTYIQGVRSNYLAILSACLVVMFVFVIMIFFLFKDSYKALYYISSGFLGAGIADVLISLLLVVSKANFAYKLSPIEFNAIFVLMTKACFGYGFIAGVFTLLIGVLLILMAIKQEKDKQRHKDTRFFKIVTKL